MVTAEVEVPVRVPDTAVIRMDDGDDVVFVASGDSYSPRPVTIGRRNHVAVEIVTGLEPGEGYVARGGFNLKAELGKAGFAAGHGH